MAEQLPADERAVRSGLIALAAEMAQGGTLPSDFSEDHPARMRRSYWLKQLERSRNVSRDWAMRLKAIADQLGKQTS